jgi:hypothetical protein
MSSLFGSRHGALNWILRETHRLEELGLRVQNLPFLAKSIRISHDGFAITGDHVAGSESAHEANTLAKLRLLALLKQDGHKVLVGLDLNALAPAQMDFKNTLLVGGLRIQERKSAECDRQVSAKHTVEVVDALTLDFENICTDTEHGAGNVRHITSHVRTNVHIQAQTRHELCNLEENEIAHTVKVESVSLPSFEMRIALGASFTEVSALL